MFKNVMPVLFACTISTIVAVTATYITLSKHPDLTPADGVLVNGMSYHGDLVNGLLQGNAVLEDASGERYSGFFVDGMMQGQGTYTDGIGGHYTGAFVDGSIHGEGVYTYFDESKYAGFFKKGTRYGRGKLTYTNGDLYEGEFSEGFMHGEGRFVFHDSSSYTGRFEKNAFVEGKAALSGAVLEGEFLNWTLNGKGKISLENGLTTEGVFSDGLISGQGTQTLADKSKYHGEFEDGMKHGHGELLDADGNTYTGSFEYDTYHGKGTLVLAKPVNEINSVSGQWNWGYLENDPRKPKRNYSNNIEKLLYSQTALLNDALTQVEETNSESADLFFLGLAGHGKQDVFLNEIQYLRDYLQPYAGSRTVTLVNNHKTIGEYPLATRHSVGEALLGIEDKMDVKNDVLFVYMTSHGSKKHDFSLKLDGMTLPAINPVELSTAFDKTKIKWKVIVISACYSGGFIDELKNENTLIITAARSDRTSFGCGDKSEMTYFGRAYLKDALPETLSFIDAFSDAQEQVEKWEVRDFPEAKRSMPQISLGENIRKKLELWKHPLGG